MRQYMLLTAGAKLHLAGVDDDIESLVEDRDTCLKHLYWKALEESRGVRAGNVYTRIFQNVRGPDAEHAFSLLLAVSKLPCVTHRYLAS